LGGYDDVNDADRLNLDPVMRWIVGRPWSEPTLIEIAYGYEQATHHRHPPSSVPPLG
jgi:hypothetical protein